MAQDTIDKIINIQFRYSDLIKGWEAASTAIDTAKAKLQKFKEAGDSEGVAKQALYLIEILHQTTTPRQTIMRRFELYLIEILHQTTTDLNP